MCLLLFYKDYMVFNVNLVEREGKYREGRELTASAVGKQVSSKHFTKHYLQPTVQYEQLLEYFLMRSEKAK